MIKNLKGGLKVSNNIIKLNDKFYAKCPDCGSQEWLIRVDGVGDQWENIKGTECKYCELIIDWVKAERDEKDSVEVRQN